MKTNCINIKSRTKLVFLVIHYISKLGCDIRYKIIKFEFFGQKTIE